MAGEVTRRRSTTACATTARRVRAGPPSQAPQQSDLPRVAGEVVVWGLQDERQVAHPRTVQHMTTPSSRRGSSTVLSCSVRLVAVMRALA